MKKRTPVPAYILLLSLSNKLKLLVNHYKTPCSWGWACSWQLQPVFCIFSNVPSLTAANIVGEEYAMPSYRCGFHVTGLRDFEQDMLLGKIL